MLPAWCGGRGGEARRRGLTCSFIRFLLAPVPTLMILVANSTPMVCEDSTLHSFFTKRCSKQDLRARSFASSQSQEFFFPSSRRSGRKKEYHSLARPARSQ